MSGVRVARVARERRQVEDSDQEEESELGRLARLLDEIEESLVSSLESMIVNQDAQDRILLEDVQVTTRFDRPWLDVKPSEVKWSCFHPWEWEEN